MFEQVNSSLITYYLFLLYLSLFLYAAQLTPLYSIPIPLLVPLGIQVLRSK